LEAAAEFLLSVASEAPAEAAAQALVALASSRYRSEMQTRAAAIVEARDEPALRRAFEHGTARGKTARN